MTERCQKCKRFMGNAKVGVGKGPIWICLRCFDRIMAGIGEQMRVLRDSFAQAEPR